MNGKVPIDNRPACYYDDSPKLRSSQYHLNWTNELITNYKNRFTPNNIRNKKEGESSYGNESCSLLLNAFEDYNINNKTVAVVGSRKPWIEAILLNLNNKVTTIEYNVPEANFDNLKCYDYFNYFENNRKTFDVIVTFSSVEHSGLGRYGDPLDPDGDIKTMDVIYNNLKDDGLLIWGAPVGKDIVVWNAHRIYGKHRLPIMFNKFEQIKWYGQSKETLYKSPLGAMFQPVVVLKAKN